jgi:hypothetical protein
MSNLREALAATSCAGLAWDETAEKAVDRVAASGFADQLGLWLWKAKYMLEASAYQHAQEALAGAYNRRYRDAPHIRIAMVEQALREYLGPNCTACHGLGEMMAGERKIVCEKCGGSRIHRYSDFERARTMKLAYGRVKASAHKLRWLVELMNDADRRVNVVLNEQLERA